jgi:hypothetical protein
MPEPLTPGDEIDVEDGFVVAAFAAYAATASHDLDQPATPIVLLDLQGYFQSELPLPPGAAYTRSIRLIFEERGATETAQGMINSLRQLDAVRRNQER